MTIATAILDLLRQRGPGKSICPSEVARQLYPADWREHMEEIRTVARDLAREGRVRITQRERELDPGGEWVGPIRLRLPG